MPAKGDAYDIVLDAQGKTAWGRAYVGGDTLVAVLTEGYLIPICLLLKSAIDGRAENIAGPYFHI
ncbi:hypothetical protein [Methylocystis echinoides]|uniref:hypothetical protein n=1 Tax=Methylocystis echinoides TaxID=29468 RepID=UPI00341C16ED